MATPITTRDVVCWTVRPYHGPVTKTPVTWLRSDTITTASAPILAAASRSFASICCTLTLSLEGSALTSPSLILGRVGGARRIWICAGADGAYVGPPTYCKEDTETVLQPVTATRATSIASRLRTRHGDFINS